MIEAGPIANATTNKLWPRSTSLFLLLVGLALSLTSFVAVLSMPEHLWHPARDAELRSTFEAYQKTGTLLIKPTGSGSYYTQAPSSGPMSSAAWDDDPGSYIIASVMGKITQSDSPYPGLELAQALLVALPLLWLPTAVARVFKRARAGYALILLPPVMWLLNNGTILVGTEYGLSDAVSTLRVYALYGIAASLAFLSLSLLLLFSTYRLRLGALIGVTLLFGVLATFGNLSRSLSGVGVAVAVGMLWWLHSKRKWRWVIAPVACLATVALAFGLQSAAMGAINSERIKATGQTMEELPDAHGTWHPLYLGLSYPQPLTGQPSAFDVVWSDEFGWDKARDINPDVIIAGEEYDLILKDLYLEKVTDNPADVAKLYVKKALFVIKHFGAMIGFILVGFVLALMRRSGPRKAIGAGLAITATTIVLGLVPPVLVMPMLYYYSELSAALGLLVALSLGALVWSLTSMPSHVRASERGRLNGRRPADTALLNPSVVTSVIVPCRNGVGVIEDTVTTLASVLSARDEIIVVENGSTDGTALTLQRLSEGWNSPCGFVVLHSEPGLGEALRTGVLSSKGQKLLLSADDLPFGLTDYERFTQLSDDVIVAIGSKAHPESEVRRGRRRTVQSRIFRFLREALLQSRVGDSQGTIWTDGDWGRAFATVSRESGLMWTTELVLAAEQQGIAVCEVPVRLREGHESVSSRFRLSDAWQSIVGFTRLAIYKDDYQDENWAKSAGTVDDSAVATPKTVVPTTRSDSAATANSAASTGAK